MLNYASGPIGKCRIGTQLLLIKYINSYSTKYLRTEKKVTSNPPHDSKKKNLNFKGFIWWDYKHLKE